MRISSTQIEHFLLAENIEFEWSNPKNDYTVASIKKLVNQGFYYCSTNNLKPEFKESLILVSSQFPRTEFSSDNSWIILKKADPQLVYYKIIRHYFADDTSSGLSSKAEIHPEAEISEGVSIESFCKIGRCKIGKGSSIGSNSVIHDNTEIGENTAIAAGSVIGASGLAWVWDDEDDNRVILPQLGDVSIGNNCILGANSIVVRGSLNESTHIGDFSMMAPGCRLGHGTQIGVHVHLANNVVTAGNVSIGDSAFIGSSAVFRPGVKIHKNTIVAAGAVVVKNTSKPGLTLIGVPAKETKTKEKPSGMPRPNRTTN